MNRLVRLGDALERRLRLKEWTRALKIMAAPGAILVLFAITIALSLGALIYAQHVNTSIVERDMRLVSTLDEVAAQFDHADGDLYRLMVDKAARRGGVDIAPRTAAIKRNLQMVRAHLISVSPMLLEGDRARIPPIVRQIDTYAEAVDVVSAMLDIDFASSAAMLAPFRTNADRVIADIKAIGDTGVSNARNHALVAMSRTRLLVALVSAAMLLLAILSVIWLALASHRGLKLRNEISLRQSAEASALTLARHDGLTDLMNRRAFVESITTAIAGHSAGDEPFSVFLIDLDAFKAINDLHGHAAGDAVLKSVSERLRRATPHDATVARLGGDEFAVLLPSRSSQDELSVIAQQIKTGLGEPVHWQRVALRVGVSIGAATYPGDATTTSDLLHAADLAMYSVKRKRKGSFRFFDVSMEKERFERLQLQEELRTAIAAGEVQPFYQPVVYLPGNELCGFEILARWYHPRLGLLTPDHFIQVAEETDQINALTESILRQACGHLRRMPDGLRLALNVSPTQFTDVGLAANLVGIVRAAGLCPSRFEVEITEDAVMDDIELVAELISSFRSSGMTVALDDFGTGFSGLSTLRRLHFDNLKIDRSFTHNLLGNDKNLKIVDAIIGLADGFHMQVTAEGIEDSRIADLLASKGCARGQGFLFGRAMPFSEILYNLDASVGEFTCAKDSRARSRW